MAKSTNQGYPRIGKKRELKRVIERYWRGKATTEDIVAVSAEIRRSAFVAQRDAGIDLVPCNDFTLYDQMLDLSALWGLIPERYRHTLGSPVPIDTYFAMARGNDTTTALEMTKWFDTNYHYLVPEFDAGSPLRTGDGPVDAYREARDIVGDAAVPVLIGPVTFVLLGKHHTKSFAEHLDDLLSLYVGLISDLVAAGASWIQIDEPTLVQDRTPEELALYQTAYERLSSINGAQIMLQTYFGSLGDCWTTVMNLPVAGIGLDFVRSPGNLELLTTRGFPEDKVLSAGVVNGRGVWKADLNASMELLEEIAGVVGQDRMHVGPSSSLLYLPYDVGAESRHDVEVLNNLSFAEQRLDEIVLLTRGLTEGREAIASELAADEARIQAFLESESIHQPTQQRITTLTDTDFNREKPVDQRLADQETILNLPEFPSTTIGSYPQSGEVRRMRAQARSGKITPAAYETYVHSKIDEVLSQQERAGLDVLVHGEFERSDMVEYFGELLDGFITTDNGWVQSYGTRCVRPPIIVGDVHRNEPMTVAWISYAQRQTSKPVKGMLTGPVTILNWSFPREDIPRSEIAYQIALALRDEVRDLEQAGIKIVQIDEPAMREGLPLRDAEWQDYLDWAIRAFRLASSGAATTTQIHSHMCYSEFNEIIDSIDAMGADVISIENSRSNDELLSVFTDFDYRGQIGPGVYDIHSPRIPSTEEITERLESAAYVLGADNIWVNPDCGLKTRRDDEVWPSLSNMVAAARRMRESVAVS